MDNVYKASVFKIPILIFKHFFSYFKKVGTYLLFTTQNHIKHKNK